MDKQLSVVLHGQPIGILTQDEAGKMSFQYLPDAHQALSLSLPLQSEPFENKLTQAYFGGLLPEDNEVRKLIAKKHSVSPKNDFSLLKAIGKDCAGAVSFYSIDEKHSSEESLGSDFVELTGTPLTDEELALHINDLPKKPLFSGVKDFRLSLAGVQEKAAVSVIDNQICIPTLGTPTTHILKPMIREFQETIENEYLCLKTAKAMGIEVPNAEIKTANGVKYLLIERYDREIKDKKIKRVHQEDFCQALGSNSLYKYQNEGGPTLKDCFDLLRKVSQPAVDRNKLAERVVFNYLIGNTDAHSKNFSLLHYDNGTIKLAPMYDVLCAPVYNELTKKMAMKIGGYYEYEDILPRHWERFCDEVGLSYPQFRKVLLKHARRLPFFVEDEIKVMAEVGISTDITQKISDFTIKNCTKILKKFEN